jgi:hypothetical protein
MDYLLFVGNPTSDYSQFILLLRNLGLLCNCPMRHLEGPPQCVAVENEPLLEGPLSRLGAQADRSLYDVTTRRCSLTFL